MPISMYQVSLPPLVRALTNLSATLRKAEKHAKSRGIDPTILLNARLYPDMFPLMRQIQLTTDFAKGAAARLAGVEVPKYPDNETTFAEARARIAKCIRFLRSFKARQIDGSEMRPIVLQTGRGALHFKGQSYLLSFALPNFYFHATVAYAILRHNGVELGKRDFIGPL